MDVWRSAKSPNYETNRDKLYPYSDLPLFEDMKRYELLKIPYCVQNLIEHVDYFGEGRKELSTGTVGFPDCYNVNFQYGLVKDGPDKGRRIPNRIPISTVSNIYSTRSYIKDNSALTVTVNLVHESLLSIQDIVRIVNSTRGKVIVYGYHENAIEMISDELRIMKQLFYCPIYLLPDKLQLTHFKTCFKVFLNMRELKRELYINVMKGDFEAAIILTGCLTDSHCGGALGDVVNKLLENDGNVIAYAYRLWKSNYKEVVREHFPSVFQHLFDGGMAIINKLNNQALILEPKTMKARGGSNYEPSKKLGWKIIPLWDENKVVFKIYSIDCKMYLKRSPTTGEDGKNVSEEQGGDGETFSFSPLIMENGKVAFIILNFEYNKQLLEVPVDVDSLEIKSNEGQTTDCNQQNEQPSWIVTTSNENVKKMKQTDESEDEDFSNIYDYD